MAYSMDVNLDVKFTDIEECAGDVAEYVSSERRWPDPILPGSADCEAMVLMEDRFRAISSQWICPQTRITGESTFAQISSMVKCVNDPSIHRSTGRGK